MALRRPTLVGAGMVAATTCILYTDRLVKTKTKKFKFSQNGSGLKPHCYWGPRTAKQPLICPSHAYDTPIR